jgi:hypothetical protein
MIGDVYTGTRIRIFSSQITAPGIKKAPNFGAGSTTLLPVTDLLFFKFKVATLSIAGTGILTVLRYGTLIDKI